MEETKNSTDPSPDKEKSALDEQPRTLASAERKNKKHESIEHEEYRDNAEGKPLPMPSEFEQLVATIKRFVLFVRDHGNFNAFVVVLTLVIAAATVVQGGASLLQWSATNDSIQLTRQQMLDNQAIQSAQLAIQNFTGTVEPGPTMYRVRLTYTVHNAGNSIANDIRINHGGGYSQKSGTPADIKLKSDPMPGGPSLASGQEKVYADDGFMPTWAIDTGKYDFSFDVTVSYRDIFNRSRITTDCIRYHFGHKEFYPCEFRHQHD